MFEGTEKYFLILFIIFFIVYITVKISIAALLKIAGDKKYKAYIPIYTTYALVKLLNMKKIVFWMSLIPFVGLYFLNIIIKQMLEQFNQNPKESILYVLIPMYKFPELVYKKPKYLEKEIIIEDVSQETELDDPNDVTHYFQTNNQNNITSENNYNNISHNTSTQICPSCGSPLEPGSEVCFICGYRI